MERDVNIREQIKRAIQSADKGNPAVLEDYSICKISGDFVVRHDPGGFDMYTGDMPAIRAYLYNLFWCRED